ncbi:hypothetical protein D3C81_2295390 [compost metagenome]
MGLPVRADEARTVDGEHNIGIMAANVMNNLIIGALHEGGVDGKYRLHAFHSQGRT